MEGGVIAPSHKFVVYSVADTKLPAGVHRRHYHEVNTQNHNVLMKVPYLSAWSSIVIYRATSISFTAYLILHVTHDHWDQILKTLYNAHEAQKYWNHVGYFERAGCEYPLLTNPQHLYSVSLQFEELTGTIEPILSSTRHVNLPRYYLRLWSRRFHFPRRRATNLGCYHCLCRCRRSYWVWSFRQ